MDNRVDSYQPKNDFEWIVVTALQDLKAKLDTTIVKIDVEIYKQVKENSKFINNTKVVIMLIKYFLPPSIVFNILILARELPSIFG